jgi:hypothetical protein
MANLVLHGREPTTEAQSTCRFALYTGVDLTPLYDFNPAIYLSGN